MLFYSSTIFEDGGATQETALIATIFLGVCASLGAVAGSFVAKVLSR